MRIKSKNTLLSPGFGDIYCLMTKREAALEADVIEGS